MNVASQKQVSDERSCDLFLINSERELTFTFAVCYRRSVCLFVVCLSVCDVGAPNSAG